MTGLWIALAAIVLALGFGGYRALTDGRFRGTHAVRGAGTAAGSGAPAGGATGATGDATQDAGLAPSAWTHVVAALPEARLGERATLVQFSSSFCAPCRTTRVTLGQVAASEPGVVHLEIDAEHHLELVRHLDVLRTPTTLVLDASGREVTRAAGAPRREQVLAALPA